MYMTEAGMNGIKLPTVREKLTDFRMMHRNRNHRNILLFQNKWHCPLYTNAILIEKAYINMS